MYGVGTSNKLSPFGSVITGGPSSSSIGTSHDSMITNDHINSINKELFIACKNGDINKVRKLVNSSNVNICDSNGRKSTVSQSSVNYKLLKFFLLFSHFILQLDLVVVMLLNIYY